MIKPMTQDMQPFKAESRLRDLIDANSSILMTLSRFGLSLGFGNATVDEVCRAGKVHTGTFLAVCNFTSARPVAMGDVDIRALMDYLRGAHVYFLNFCIPQIRQKLISVVDCSAADNVGLVVLRFFDDYVAQVRAHMDYEDRQVFRYVDTLLAGQLPDDYNIDRFARHHDSISSKLTDLKDIIIRFVPNANGDMLNSTLFDIINCESDLQMHCHLEDRLFVPVVARLERLVAGGKYRPTNAAADDADRLAAQRLEMLSAREREVVTMVACGLSNKEIADRMCLSVHTITTHRRNIAAKLNIHSTAAMAVFAVVNKLVTIDQIKL